MNAQSPLSARVWRFYTLLRREVWEHKGSFVWLPLIAAGITLLLTWGGIVASDFIRVEGDGGKELSLLSIVVRDSLARDSITVQTLFQPGLEPTAHLIAQLNLTLAVFSGLPYVALAFTVFFYCLGALYDDRRDRSVLFWKSLPVPDIETVLSKVLSAVLIAPLLATLVYFGLVLVTLSMLSVFALVEGGSALLLWRMAEPLSLGWAQLAALPGYALSILPVVGWLLLCSAWARSKPLLWALAIPVSVGVCLSWFDLLQALPVSSDDVWTNGILRLLGDLFGLVETWRYLPEALFGDFLNVLDISGDNAPGQPGAVFRDLAQPRLWIGAVIGALMIAAAIALRRWREEA